MHIIEPIKPIQNFVYRCDSRFFVEPVLSMFQEHEKYGFVIIDGTGMMLATLQGNTREVLFRYQVSLPKKHHKGGQSAVRFARLRLEARQNYVTKMEEACRLNFIDRQTNRPTVKALFLAGNADFKLELQKVLEPRLAAIVGGLFQIQYGGMQGLNHAIEQAGPQLAALPLVHQRAVLSQYFNEIARDTGLFVFGHQQVLAALEQGAVETLLLWDQLPEQRFEVEAAEYRAVRLGLDAKLADNEKVVAVEPLLDWLVGHHANFGCRLELIADATPEGQQFCVGFGGLGGLLRFPVPALVEEQELVEDSDSEDDDSFWN